MRIGLAGQGMDECDVVGQFGEARDQVADPLAGLSALAEWILRPRQISRWALERHRGTAFERLAIHANELWLVVPRLQLAHCAGTKNHDDVLRASRMHTHLL